MGIPRAILSTTAFLYLVFCSLSAQGQDLKEPGEDHAILVFMRTGNIWQSHCASTVSMPNQFKMALPLKSIIYFTCYSEGTVPVSVDVACEATEMASATFETRTFNVNVAHGNTYYFLYHGSDFSPVPEKKFFKKKPEKYQENVLFFKEDKESPILDTQPE